MSTTVTAQEAVLRERQAYIRGLHNACWRDPATYTDAMRRAEGDAAREYPFPKVQRPRVIRDSRGLEWKVSDGELRWRNPGCTWAVAIVLGNNDSASRLADLLANPTELVDDDGSPVRDGSGT